MPGMHKARSSISRTIQYIVHMLNYSLPRNCVVMGLDVKICVLFLGVPTRDSVFNKHAQSVGSWWGCDPMSSDI